MPPTLTKNIILLVMYLKVVMVLELITSLEYELEVNRYIHLNPIRAKMVEDLDDYQWSSYFYYIGHKKDDLVTTERIFIYFPEPKVENYLRFLQSIIGQ